MQFSATPATVSSTPGEVKQTPGSSVDTLSLRKLDGGDGGGTAESIDDQKLHPSATSAYRPSGGQVASVYVGAAIIDRGVTLCAGISYLAIGYRLDKYLAAFKSIRPLLVHVAMLNPRRAYRAFKCFSRLQRLCARPYLPPLENAKPLEAANPSDYAFVKRVTRYVKFAAGVYPGVTLDCQDIIIKPREMRGRKGIERYIARIIPGAKVIDRQPEALVERPAWWLYRLDEFKELILAIQGSSSYSDWVTNLICNPCDPEGCHLGMKRAAARLDRETRKTVVAFLEKYPDYTMVLTGHSLGGGVATLIGLHWIQSLPDKLGSRVRVCSIGSPGVVAQEHASRFKEQIVSVVFGRDLIPRLSYGSVRDLLVTLHGLAKASKIKGLPTVSDIHALDNELPVQAHDPDDEWSISDGDVEELEVLPSPLGYRIDKDGSPREVPQMPLFDEIDDGKSTTASVDTSNSMTVSIQLPHGDPLSMSGHQRRSQIRHDILSAMVCLPIQFSELSRLCRTRAAELDERINVFRMKPQTKSIWQKALGCCCGDVGNVCDAESLLDIQRQNEMTVMNESLDVIMAAAVAPVEEMMVPAGRVVLIMPRLHFLECDKPTPSIINRGQCILVEMEGQAVLDMVKEPVWNFECISDHSVACYLQGLAPELLRALPGHTSVVTAQVAKARAARLNPKIEAMDQFQRNKKISTPALNHVAPETAKTPAR